VKPEKDDAHALVDLVDVLLREGAVIQADVVVTVADVPLLGISLRAAVAGMATMTEYGLLEEWDDAVRTRAVEDPAPPGAIRTAGIEPPSTDETDDAAVEGRGDRDGDADGDPDETTNGVE
jgi:hypothetical protein